MHKISIGLSYFICASFIPFAITCVQPNSPFSDNYKGDYHLTIQSDSLPDTLNPQVTYRVPVITGSDTFSSFQGWTKPPNALDTSILFSRTDSGGVSLRFFSLFTGYVYIKAIRPNGRYLLDSFLVVVRDGRTCANAPIVFFRSDSLSIAQGDSTTVSAVDSNAKAAEFHWTIDAATSPIVTRSPWVRIAFSDSAWHVLRIWGVDSCGQSGTKDSIIIRARSFQYRVTKGGLFPDTIRAKMQAVWTVSVDSLVKFTNRDGKYYWHIVTGTTTTDTSGAQLDTLRLTVPDSTVMTISVYVKDSAGAVSADIIQPVIVRTFRPYSRFLQRQDTTRIGKPLLLRARTVDTDPNGQGSIDSVYWDEGADGAIDSINRDSSFTVTYQTPGTYKVSVQARDNMGFWSAPDTATILVRADLPYFNPPARDTAIFINLSLLMKVNANMGASKVPIVKYLWRFAGAITAADSTAADTLRKQFTTAGKCTVIVACRDADGLISASPDTFVVTVSAGNPVVSSFSPETAWIFDSTSYRIRARDVNAGGRVTEYLVQWEPGGAWQSSPDSLVKHAYTTPGRKAVRVVVKDNDATYSDTLRDSVMVLLGKPQVIALRKPGAAMYINDQAAFTISASDPNGTVDSFFVSWAGAPFSRSHDSTFNATFSTSGMKRAEIIVRDNDGIFSDTLRDSVFVHLGKPVAAPAFPDSVWYLDTVAYKLRGTDTNGTITQWAVQWDAGQPFETRTDSAFSHSYMVAGAHAARVYVVDNDGINSDTANTSVYVKLGKPVVLSIAPDSIIYINDARRFAIATFDTNGTVDSVKIDNGSGSFGAFVKTNNGAYTLSRMFSRLEAGGRTIRVIAKDNDGLLSDTVSLAVPVHLGAPVVDSLHFPSVLWVRDNNSYAVFAHDTNSAALDSFEVDWDNNGTYDSKNKTGVFFHAFDTSQSGARSIKVRVMDEDTNWTLRTFSVNVKLGRPVLRGGATYGYPIQWIDDSLFYVYTGGNPTFTVDTIDSNGTIQKFFWDIYGDGVNDSTNIPYWTQFVPAGAATKIVVTGRDDDQLISMPFAFYMYPDAPPPATTTTTSDAVASVRKIFWTGKDVKDGNATQYKLVIKKGSASSADSITVADESNPAYIVQDFRAGSLYDSGSPNFDFSYTYAPTGGTGVYHYRIVSKDARGSLARNAGDQLFSF